MPVADISFGAALLCAIWWVASAVTCILLAAGLGFVIRRSTRKRGQRILCSYILLVGVAALTCGCGRPLSFGERYSDGGQYGGYAPDVDQESRTVYFGAPSKSDLGDIYAFQLDSGVLRKIYGTKSYEGSPVVSVGGQIIAFESEHEGQGPHIYVMDVKEGRPRRLTMGRYPEFGPVISSDGKIVAFTRRLARNPDYLTFDEVFIAAADAQNEEQLTRNKIPDYPISFSGDGKRLYFAAQGGNTGSFDLFRVDLGSRESSLVLPLGVVGGLGTIAVSSDEKFVAFISDRDVPFEYEVYTCDISGGNIEKLTELKGYIGSIRFANRGNELLSFDFQPKYGHPESIADIIIVNRITKELRKISWTNAPVRKM